MIPAPVRMLRLCLLCFVAALANQGCATIQKGMDAVGDAVEGVAEIGEDTLEKYEQSQAGISRQEEIEIGANLTAGLLGAAPPVDDPDLQTYVNDVGFWLASQSSRKNLPWRFVVIESDGINAFSAPGGYVAITSGLFDLLENEAQLAGVLAHEIGHVVNRHHVTVLRQTMKQEFWVDLSTSVLGDTEARGKVKGWAQSGLQLYTTGLGRDFEFDADLYGVVLAAQAGYDAFALLDVLTTIDSIDPHAIEVLLMLNTHPPSAERLDRLTARMESRNEDFLTGQSNSIRFARFAANQ